MKTIIGPVDRELIIEELSSDKFIRDTNRGDNKLFEVTAEDSPHTMREIARLRELSFRTAGGGTGKELDIDHYDTEVGYKQLIVWDPKDEEILGGYRYLHCDGRSKEELATGELFDFSPQFTEEYLPYTIELGRSFVQPLYQSRAAGRKALFALDNLWDGLGALILRYPEIKYFFGKVTMYPSYNQEARDTLLYFLKKYFNDTEQLVTPNNPLDFSERAEQLHPLFDGKEYQEGYKVLSKEIRGIGETIPPLINSYMGLSPSMKVFGTALNKEFGLVEETGILINITEIYPEKVERHLSPLRALAHKYRPKWWRNR